MFQKTCDHVFDDKLKWNCPFTKIFGTLFTKYRSGVVEGERRSPKYILGNAVPPNNIRTSGNGDTVAFHQIGLQRNEKSR